EPPRWGRSRSRAWPSPRCSPRPAARGTARATPTPRRRRPPPAPAPATARAARAPSDVPGRATGMDLISVLAVARATEQGAFSAESEVIRVSRVRGAEWEERALGEAERGAHVPTAATR